MIEKLKKYSLISGGAFILIFFLVPLITLKSSIGIFSAETAVVGDTFGGILGPIIAFFGVLATFWAFYIQYEANIEQKKQFKRQELDLKVERFENRFFELIKIHRENVEDVVITGKSSVKSRKAFISMFNELRACYHIVYEIRETTYKYLNIDDKDLVNIAFVLFYIGVGSNSNPLSLKLLSKYNEDFINDIIYRLSEIKKSYVAKPNQYKIKISAISKLPELDAYLKYKPFCGHISRLGHYFRHLWMTVKYLDIQDESVIKDKYEYIKIFRAQISSYEQLLLHYNSLTDLGNAWITEGLIKKYKLTKNIPVPMAYFGPDINQLYDDINYFEWNEIS